MSKKSGLRLRLLQSVAYSSAAREALFVKLASDLCDLWPDSLAATTMSGERCLDQCVRPQALGQ